MKRPTAMFETRPRKQSEYQGGAARRTRRGN
jgi:hypothetical protein